MEVELEDTDNEVLLLLLAGEEQLAGMSEAGCNLTKRRKTVWAAKKTLKKAHNVEQG